MNPYYEIFIQRFPNGRTFEFVIWVGQQHRAFLVKAHSRTSPEYVAGFLEFLNRE
jgi:hypothetical protein